jgi:hypothetical protein
LLIKEFSIYFNSDKWFHSRAIYEQDPLSGLPALPVRLSVCLSGCNGQQTIGFYGKIGFPWQRSRKMEAVRSDNSKSQGRVIIDVLFFFFMHE